MKTFRMPARATRAPGRPAEAMGVPRWPAASPCAGLLVLCLLAGSGPVGLLAGSGTAGLLAAQEEDAPPTGTVVGMVYDSTANAPLAGATIALMGTAAIGESSEDGQFRLDDVPAGEHEVAFFHPRLAVLGISSGPTRVVVPEGGTADAYLAVPSRETIIAAWCSAEPGAGAGAVSLGGVVTDALTGVPLPRAVVKVRGEREGALRTRTVLAETRTEDNGEYLICNVPAGAEAIVQVEFGSTRNLPAPVRSAGAHVLDMSITISEPVTITGSVVDYGSRAPLVGARVQLLGTDFFTLTDSAGRFGFSSVPPGRQTIETGQLGYATRIDSLTAFSNEALGLEIALSTEAIALAPIVVTGRRGQNAFTTVGTRFVGLTEAEVDSIAQRVVDFAGLVREVRQPSVRVRETFMPNAFGQMQMGMCIEMTRRRTASTPNTCNMVEVRINEGIVPEPAFFLLELNPQDVRRVQFISPMDASLLYGDRAANGVLLIYTR